MSAACLYGHVLSSLALCTCTMASAWHYACMAAVVQPSAGVLSLMASYWLVQVHVKNRCAWVNHSSNPQAFIQLVHKYPNIRLWFSGELEPLVLLRCI